MFKSLYEEKFGYSIAEVDDAIELCHAWVTSIDLNSGADPGRDLDFERRDGWSLCGHGGVGI